MPNIKIFPRVLCTKCIEPYFMMTTNDGNRTQTCMSCGKVTLKDGEVPTEDVYDTALLEEYKRFQSFKVIR